VEHRSQDAIPDPAADLIPDASPGAVAPGRVYTLSSDPLEYVTAFERALVLSACPPGTTLREVSFAPQYTVKGPALVRVALPDGSEWTLVVKRSGSRHGLVTEAKLFPVLTRLGLPVPEVLAGPAFDHDCTTWRPSIGPALSSDT
jgi:hypothetical protein